MERIVKLWSGDIGWECIRGYVKERDGFRRCDHPGAPSRDGWWQVATARAKPTHGMATLSPDVATWVSAAIKG